MKISNTMSRLIKKPISIFKYSQFHNLQDTEILFFNIDTYVLLKLELKHL